MTFSHRGNGDEVMQARRSRSADGGINDEYPKDRRPDDDHGIEIVLGLHAKLGHRGIDAAITRTRNSVRCARRGVPVAA
jgi:hypothetical protein